MSLLTQQEIEFIAYDADTAKGPVTFARAIEQAVIAKLATVSVIPDLVDMAKDSHGHCIICGVSPSKVIEALAATRVQALEEAARVVDVPEGCEAHDIRGGQEGMEMLLELAESIRALIGGKND